MFERYKVLKGDTLSMIAKKFNTDIDMLKNINDFYFLDNIREGMDMIVPQNNNMYYDVIKNEKATSLVDVAKKYNVNPNLFSLMNGLEIDDLIYENQEVLIPKKNFSYYITKDGDTMDTVSQTFNISKDRLLSQNQTLYLLGGQILVNKKLKI